jgi:hypothetical protein
MALQLLGPILCDVSQLMYLHFYMNSFHGEYLIRYQFIDTKDVMHIQCEKDQWLQYVYDMKTYLHPSFITIITGKSPENGLCLINVNQFDNSIISKGRIHVYFNKKSQDYLPIDVENPEQTIWEIMKKINDIIKL